MKYFISNKYIVVLFVCIFSIALTAQNEVIFEQPVGIDSLGSNVDPSSILDLNSDRRGVLIPRLTTAQRLVVANPATGLLLFDTDTNSFWFYNGSGWSDLSSSVSSSSIADTDNDTKIDVESSADEDTIRFSTAGYEIMKLDNKTLHLGAADGSLFIGKNAGSTDDGTSNFSTGVGFEALKNDATGWFNTALGYKALSKNSAGDNNTAVGAYAMENTHFGDFNVAVGQGSMMSSSSGAANVAVGYHSLNKLIGGKHNVALGIHALDNSISGQRNIGIGNRSMFGASAGDDNVSIGDSTLFVASGQSDNVVLGSRAAQNVNGSRNTYIGYEAGRGDGINSAHDNVFLGYQAGYHETGGNKLYIDNTDTDEPLIYGSFSSNLLRINGELNIADEYSFPEVDGSTGAVLQTNGSGVVDWVESSILSPLEIAGTTIRQSSNYTDDFLIGRDGVPSNGSTINDGFLLFDNSKHALRVGRLIGTNFWAPDSIGTYSVAMGLDTKAKGEGSFAMGNRSFSEGNYSMAVGTQNIVKGFNSFALGGNNNTAYDYNGTLGRGLTTGSIYEVVLGTYNTTYTANNSTAWNVNDRLLVVGNGMNSVTRSDAMIVHKNGNTTINGKITAGLASNNYTFPLEDGSANQRLMTDGSGTILWDDAPEIVFENESGVLKQTGSYSNDFLVGSANLPANGVNAVDGLMFYDNSKYAFRSGFLNVSASWAPDSIGVFSTAMGINTKAKGSSSFAIGNRSFALGASSVAGGENVKAVGTHSISFGRSNNSLGSYSTSIGYLADAEGNYSFALGYDCVAENEYSLAMGRSSTTSGNNALAIGYDNIASGSSSVALGQQTMASGNYSTALGLNTAASGRYSTSMGSNTTALSSYETTIGRYNTDYSPNSTVGWNTLDRLFVVGNGSSVANKSNALIVYKSGNTEIQNDLDIGYNLTVGKDAVLLEDLDVDGVTNLEGDLTLGNDMYTGAMNGVINVGGGFMDNTSNFIADTAPVSPLANGDEDLFIEGDLQIGGTPYKPGGGSWTTSSDVRLKKNIAPFNDGLEKVLQIRPVNFMYNNVIPENDDGKNYVGIIAQEMLEVAPYMISESQFGKKTTEVENGQDVVIDEGETFYTYDSSALIYMLVNAVKELKNDNDNLKERLELLENK